MTARRRHQVSYRGPAILFATSLPLWLGTLLNDWAYARTFVIQWTNFASWLNAGALVVVGLVLAWSLLALLFRSSTGRRRPWLFVLLVAAVFVVGFINALVHAKDAWAAMPAGIILSLAVCILAAVAAWVGLSARDTEEAL